MPNTITPKDVYELQRGEDAEAIARAQEEIGGKIYRIAPEDFVDLEKRIAKLNRKAEKIGADPVSVEVIETVEEARTIKNDDGQDEEKVFTYSFVLLKGKTPMVPGFTFLATLDHTIQDDQDDPVTIARTPFQSKELNEIDLEHYRRAENRCDHCGYKRRRNHTYILLNDDEGSTMQVGSDCLRDFTGANNPERIAQWCEWLSGLDYDLEIGGGDGAIFKSGRTADRIIDYLDYVASSIRQFGWGPRWVDGERSFNATADKAWQMMDADRKNYRKPGYENPVTAEDHALAVEALDWARAMADQDELSEFDANIVAVTNSQFMPRKGDGIVAYVVEGFKRAQRKQIEREKAAERKPVIEGKVTVTGTVTKLDWKYNDYTGDQRHVMTVLDDRGFAVWGTVPRSIDGITNPVEEGSRVEFNATITKSDNDDTFGFFKRPTNGRLI